MAKDKSFEIVKDDITKRVIAKFPGNPLFNPKSLTVTATVTLPDDVEAKEPRMVMAMTEACCKEIPPLINKLGDLLKKHVNQAANDYLNNSTTKLEKICESEEKKFEVAAEKEFNAYQKSCKKAVEKIFNSCKTRKAAYKSYKVKVAANLVVGTAVFATGVVMLSTGGPAAPLGIYNTIKAGTALVQSLVKLWMTAEKVESKIKLDLAIYKKVWEEVSKKKAQATFEIVGKVLHFGGGAVFQEAIPNISTFAANVKLFTDKLNGIDGEVDKLSRSVMGYVSEQDDIRAKMIPLEKRYVDLAKVFGDLPEAKKKVMNTGKMIADLNGSLVRVEVSLKNTLKSVDEMNKSLEKGREAAKGYTSMVNEFKGKKWPSKTLFVTDLSLAAGDMLSRGLCAKWENVGRDLGGMAAKTVQYGGKLTKIL